MVNCRVDWIAEPIVGFDCSTEFLAPRDDVLDATCSLFACGSLLFVERFVTPFGLFLTITTATTTTFAPMFRPTGLLQ